MAAYRDSRPTRLVGVGFALYLCAGLGLVGMILWKLWTEVLAAAL